MCVLRALILPTVSYGWFAVMGIGIAVSLRPRAKGVGSLGTQQVGVSDLFGYFPFHLGAWDPAVSLCGSWECCDNPGQEDTKSHYTGFF